MSEAAKSDASISTSPESRVAAIVTACAWRMDCLRAVGALGLPDAWIGAGFVRAAVWDRLHERPVDTPLDDVDLIYFDTTDPEGAREAEIEWQAAGLGPPAPWGGALRWSARNQARMHRRNGDAPYRDTADALRHWLETPTCVAVRLDPEGRVKVLAPLGLEDLLGLVVRPTPHALSRPEKLTEYRQRVAGKGWAARWPLARLVSP